MSIPSIKDSSDEESYVAAEERIIESNVDTDRNKDITKDKVKDKDGTNDKISSSSSEEMPVSRASKARTT